jgi:hypothetical protein
MVRCIITVPILDLPAPKECAQPSFPAAPPASNESGAMARLQRASAFSFSFVVFSPRADTAAIARLDGVIVCEGTRVPGATVPRCGSGTVLARAGKAPAASGISRASVQRKRGDTLAALPSCAGAAAGSAVSIIANNTGLFIPASPDMSSSGGAALLRRGVTALEFVSTLHPVC